MCVILNIKPGQNISEDQIWSAANRNSDGFGILAFNGDGTFIQKQEYNPKGNDPDDIMQFLQDHKDKHRIGHLRFSTAGTKSIENTHPFKVLDEDDSKMFFMHNGTLHSFKDAKSNKSDTCLFVEKVVSPYISICRKAGATTKDIIFDPVTHYLLQGHASTTNVFTLFDNYGNNLTINKSQGKEFEWGWASNEYSFQTSRHEKKEYVDWWKNRFLNDYGSEDGKESKTPFEQHRNKTTHQNTSNSTTSNESSKTPIYLPRNENGTQNGSKTTTKSTDQPSKHSTFILPNHTSYPSFIEARIATFGQHIRNSVANIKGDDLEQVTALYKPSARKRFTEIAKINSLSDIIALSPEDLNEFTNDFPDAASVLIQDLLYELYLKQEPKVGILRNNEIVCG